MKKTYLINVKYEVPHEQGIKKHKILDKEVKTIPIFTSNKYKITETIEFFEEISNNQIKKSKLKKNEVIEIQDFCILEDLKASEHPCFSWKISVNDKLGYITNPFSIHQYLEFQS